MKNLIIISLLLLTASVAEAQSHQKGNLFATVGIGGGHYGYHTGGPYSRGIGLPLTLNVDYGIVDYVSAGGYFGVLFKDRSSAIGFGGRGSFHFWQLLNDKVSGDLMGDVFDIYVSAYSGAEVSGLRRDRFRAGGILGARWFFSPNISLTAEFGGPMSYAMIGMSFKLIN